MWPSGRIEKKTMLTRINAAKCIGIDAVGVSVETDITHGIGIHLVGLADTAVKESLLRVLTAMESLGHRIPGSGPWTTLLSRAVLPDLQAWFSDCTWEAVDGYLPSEDKDR